MANAKRKSSAQTKTKTFYHLCSIQVCSGEQKYIVYELYQGEGQPLTEADYWRDVLEFCWHGVEADEKEEFEEHLAAMLERGKFEAWPYDDRMYRDPWVQDITKAEYEVLSRYLHCR